MHFYILFWNKSPACALFWRSRCRFLQYLISVNCLPIIGCALIIDVFRHEWVDHLRDMHLFGCFMACLGLVYLSRCGKLGPLWEFQVSESISKSLYIFHFDAKSLGKVKLFRFLEGQFKENMISHASQRMYRSFSLSIYPIGHFSMGFAGVKNPLLF